MLGTAFIGLRRDERQASIAASAPVATAAARRRWRAEQGTHARRPSEHGQHQTVADGQTIEGMAKDCGRTLV
jgi:hypothetical protein